MPPKCKISCVCNYIQQYLNVFYALFLSPFRLKWDSSTEKYTFESAKFRKGVFYSICVLHITYFLFRQYKVYTVEQQSTSTQGIIYSQAADCIWILQNLIFLKLTLFSKEKFLDMINRISEFCTGFKVASVKVTIAIIFSSGAVVLSGLYEEWLLLRQLDGARYTTAESFLLYAFTAPMIALHPILCNFPEGLLFIISVVLLKISKHFEDIVDSENISLNIVHEYTNLKTVIDCVNTVISPLVCIHFVSVVTFYAKAFMDVSGKGLLENIDLLVFGIVNSITWINVAEFHKLVSEVMWTWLYSRKENHNIPIDVLTILVNDLTQNPIGVKCNFFFVSYKFLGTMAGLILTYGIIALSYESSSRNWLTR